MAQSSGANSGGVNRSRDKSSDSKHRAEAGQMRNTEAKPLDPGTGTDGRAPTEMKNKQRRYSRRAIEHGGALKSL